MLFSFCSFSLTLVDSLDTLVVMGDMEEFDRVVRLVVRDVSFDSDVVVSVFETNIRMVGGLISAHILADHLNQVYTVMSSPHVQYSTSRVHVQYHQHISCFFWYKWMV